MRKRTPLDVRLWARVVKTDTCWLWTGSLDSGGYGQIHGYSDSQPSMLLVHRVAWELSNGPIPDGVLVCHTCDVRNCVNPEHLFLGTSMDNIQDAVKKGRFQHGESNGSARLSEDVVTDIFILNAHGMSMRAIGRRYGVTHATIAKVLHGESWGHLWR